VHISHLSDNFVKDPNAVVTVQQKVHVTVTEVDAARKRIGLSMKSDPFNQAGAEKTKQKTAGKKTPEKPQRKEPSMEEKLAMLVNKFKK
jgi:uncharacterized protein